MSSDPLFHSNQFNFNQIVSAFTLNQLSAVMQAIALAAHPEALIMTEASELLQEKQRLNEGLQLGISRFCVVVADGFSGLLLAKADGQGQNTSDAYQVCLSFEPTAIAAFLQTLQLNFSSQSDLLQRIQIVAQNLHPNDPQFQSQFALKLATLASPSAAATGVDRKNYSTTRTFANEWGNVHCESLAEQERVFNQIATRIRQTQELSVILETTLQEVRSFLQVDRLVIYQFEARKEPVPPSNLLVSGRITYETRANDSVPRILNLSEGAQCFINIPRYKEKYSQGIVQAIPDIQWAYKASPCLVKLLQWAQVRAKLVVPIVVQEQLWGLLIAHQSCPRQWQESEIHFVRHIAELMAIAIYQTQLYGQLQQQAQSLEQQFVERTQELHEALSAAQSASLAKSEFLAAISHELRTPLTSIIGMSATLLRLPTDSRGEQFISLEKQRNYLKIIRNSGEHLLELINDILDLSQAEAGRTILDIREFSLTQIANESLKMLRHKAQEKGVHLALEMQLGDAATVAPANRDRFAADPRRVQQILLNLLSNAIKFTMAGGQVTLRIWVEQGQAIFQIEDTGIGIPEHQFSLLFKKFQQLDASYQRQYGGTGLGLALTRQLVELHGGQIEMESTVNVGSVFTVYLPAQPLKDDRKSSSNSGETIRLQGRVVLIENHEATATLLCELLTAAGHQVIWMIDGMTAIQQIELLKPEAVVVTTQLAGMGIHEFLERLRQNPVTQSIKVLVLTEAGNGIRDRWQAAGADDVAPLPIDYPELLLDQVAQLINCD